MQNHKFTLKPSKYYCVFLGIALLASVVVVVSIQANIWIKALVLILLAFYGSYTYLRYALLKTSASVIGLQQMANGEWQVTSNGGVMNAELKGDSTVTPFLSVLRFNIAGKRLPLSCIILKDSLSGDDYRRLVGLLRMSD